MSAVERRDDGEAQPGAAVPQHDGAWRWNPRVACRTLDGNAFVLLDGRMIRLNEVGTVIWEQLEHGTTLDAIVQHVVEHYDTDAAAAARDAGDLVSSLVDRKMLVPA